MTITKRQAQNRWVTRMEAAASANGDRRPWMTAAGRARQNGQQARWRAEARRSR